MFKDSFDRNLPSNHYKKPYCSNVIHSHQNCIQKKVKHVVQVA